MGIVTITTIVCDKCCKTRIDVDLNKFEASERAVESGWSCNIDSSYNSSWVCPKCRESETGRN